ncbi:hypothetical protein ACQPZZ_09085 [Microbispora sp. CA-135349]|uniref:hypothetical protein n=1 Tax=Microbispora sp. CA-135349 TaxID=3239953 RepID=UPI003D8DC34B
MTLGILSLVLVVAVGAGVGLVLRGGGTGGDTTRDAAATDPNTVVVKDDEIAKLVQAHTAALTSGDAKAFTSIFDKKNAALTRDQARVFANLRMPLAEQSYQVLRRQGRAEDSFGRGVTFTQDVAFVHRFAGIDLRPVSEWYRWTIEKASPKAPLVVTKVEGAPPPTGGEVTKTMYYPGPWDIWPDVMPLRGSPRRGFHHSPRRPAARAGLRCSSRSGWSCCWRWGRVPPGSSRAGVPAPDLAPDPAEARRSGPCRSPTPTAWTSARDSRSRAG